ncbi:unnamed protein product [Symbiodinium microadriaticum]|nr:unnamed protein product [Symbiodinium microadriaticum]
METPNPFWSEAVQDEFRRLQAERVTTIPREVDDEVREPDYGYDTGIAEEGLQPGNEAQGDLRPNQEEAQVLEQQSPGHRSNTGLSDISAMERGGLKRLETLGLAEVDDTELIPDYNKAPPATTPAPSAEAFPDLTDMLRTLLSGQQALADRLEKLESSKGSTSGASSSAPESRPHAVMPDQPARMVEEASGRAAPKSVKVEMGGELSTEDLQELRAANQLQRHLHRQKLVETPSWNQKNPSSMVEQKAIPLLLQSIGNELREEVIVPTQEVVNQYSELLLAECEATALAEPTKKTKVQGGVFLVVVPDM